MTNLDDVFPPVTEEKTNDWKINIGNGRKGRFYEDLKIQSPPLSRPLSILTQNELTVIPFTATSEDSNLSKISVVRGLRRVPVSTEKE